jgi:hypothetical protein
MTKYHMRASDLFETRYASLYHGTSVTNLILAVHENCLSAGGQYISLSRSIEIAKKFAGKSEATLEIAMNDQSVNAVLSDDPTHEEMAEHFPIAFAEHYYVGSWTSGGAIMVLNNEKIRARYRLRPFADDRDDHKWELEERLTRDLKPLRDYITEVKLVRNSAFGAITKAVLNGDEEAGIKPHPEYRDAINFIRSIIT